MESKKVRAEIVVSGLVQGVGFRYFVYNEATKLNINGYVQNLYTGDVYVVVETEEYLVKTLVEKLKIGNSRSRVKDVFVSYKELKNEFTNFRIKYYE